jgi:hypothetical protein
VKPRISTLKALPGGKSIAQDAQCPEFNTTHTKKKALLIGSQSRGQCPEQRESIGVMRGCPTPELHQSLLCSHEAYPVSTEIPPNTEQTLCTRGQLSPPHGFFTESKAGQYLKAQWWAQELQGASECQCLDVGSDSPGSSLGCGKSTIRLLTEGKENLRDSLLPSLDSSMAGSKEA